MGHGAELTARETGAAPSEGVGAWGCDEADARERGQEDAADVDACMVGYGGEWWR